MRGIRRGALCAALILLFTLLTGCGTAAGSELNFSACLGAAPETLDPIRAGTAQEQTIITQIYENLMKLDTQVSGETTVVNGMAKSVSSEENYDGSVTYTFRLRSAKWSDGRSVKAEDFVYAWQRLADPVSASPNAAILSAVVGYDEVRKSGDVTKLAVTAKNDSTLQVTVTGVCPWFLSDVCTAAATVPLRRDVVQSLKADAQEKNDAAAAQGQTSALTWCSDPTALVTNGAYTVKTYSDSEGLTLARRGGGSGPDTLRFLFAATAEDAWALYEAGTVDFVAPLSQAQLQELAKNPDWSATPELAVQALLFNSSADPFSDPLVRQAFSLATDRTALAAAIPASAAADALVPSGVPGVEGGDDFRTVGGSLLSAGGEAYAADQDKAKSLLAQAGFESGLSFPSLTCYYSAEDSGAAAAAAVLPQMWETALHVQVKMEALPEKELQKTLQSGEYTLALRRLTGFADDAESFLSFWKSTSENNVIRYFNSAYDTLLTVIDSASDVTGRQGCLHDAESLLLTDCPLTPLCWTGTAWKLRETDTGLCRDARGWFDFANIQTAQG